MPSDTTAHQLKITIDGIRPPIWRRVLVPSGITLAQLHRVIQEVFGWWDYHLHEFEIDGVTYGIDDGEGWGEPPVDERRTKLGKVATRGDRFSYRYDFGDDWLHRIDVEDIVPLERGGDYPRCLAGQRSRPPEDVGGPWGYAEFLAAIVDPSHDEHERWLEWAGGSFDPEACDLDEINAGLSPVAGDRPDRTTRRRQFEQRNAFTNPQFELPDPEPIELPFVHVPPPAVDVAAAVESAPILSKFEALRAYLGVEGKALTEKGNLKLADGRALVELLETGDRFDETIGDRTFKTQSTDELRQLRLIVDLAKAAGAVRVHRRRLVPVQAWAKRDSIDRAVATIRAAVDRGPLWILFGDNSFSYNAIAEFVDDGLVHWLTMLLTPGLEAAYDNVAGATKDAVFSVVAPSPPFWTEESIARSAERDLARTVDVMELLNVLAWHDPVETTNEFGTVDRRGGTLQLTALGRHVVPELAADVGYRVRSIGDLAEADAVGRADTPNGRLAGMAVFDELGAELCAPYVRQLLDSSASGHAATWMIAHGLADEESVGRFVGIGTLVDVLASCRDDPEAMCDLFLGAPTVTDADEALQQMWRHDAPETEEVLDVLGQHLPDRRLAKAARKALIQHRSWTANRR